MRWDYLLCPLRFLVRKLHKLARHVGTIRHWHTTLIFLGAGDSTPMLVTQLRVVVREEFCGGVRQLRFVGSIHCLGLMLNNRVSRRTCVLPGLLAEVLDGFSLHLEIFLELSQIDTDFILTLGVHQIFFR